MSSTIALVRECFETLVKEWFDIAESVEERLKSLEGDYKDLADGVERLELRVLVIDLRQQRDALAAEGSTEVGEVAD